MAMKKRVDDFHPHRLYSPYMSLTTRILENARKASDVKSTPPPPTQLYCNRVIFHHLYDRSHADPTGLAAASVSIFQITLQR